MPGIFIGNIITSRSGSAWTPTKPIGGETPNFWVEEGSRSGLTLIDSINPGVGDASILPAYHYNGSASNYLAISDNGALDIGASDFTLCGFFKSESTSKAAYRYIAGKGIDNNVNGRYGFFMNVTTGYIAGYAQSSGGLVIINSTIDYTTAGVLFLRVDVNLTTSKVRFFVNETQIGSDTSFTGSFGVLGNNYRFMIGGGANVTTGTYSTTHPALSSASDVWLFNRLLTTEEAATIYARGIVSGAKAHWPLLGGVMYEYDTSGNNYDLTGYVTGHTLTKANYNYGSWGSRHGLNIGYTLYQNSGVNVYVPYLDSGIERTSPPMQSTALTKVSNFAGNATNHNLSNSKILFVGSGWDKSDTDLFLDNARDTTANYYDASVPKAWHIDELNNSVINNNSVANKEGFNFVKCGDNTYLSRNGNLEVFSYDTNKTGSNLTTILTYTKDIAIYGGVDYSFQSLNIVAQRGNNVVTWDDVRYLKLSLDGGDTYVNTIDLNGVSSQISFGHIFANGNVLFCTHDKCYLSDDNFATYAEVVPKDITGADFTPSTYNNFTTLSPAVADIGGVEHLIWGNYSLDAGTEYVNVNIWETIDSGVTIKSVYLANTTLVDGTALPARHIHGVSFIPMDNTFCIYTGDGTDECNWIKGSRDSGTGAWTFTKIAGDNEPSSDVALNNCWYKTTGMLFYDGNVYFANDSDLSSRRGLFKVAYADITDKTKYIKIFPTTLALFMKGDPLTGEMIIGLQTKKQILYSKDESLFMTKTLIGGPNLMAVRGTYFYQGLENAGGYSLIGIIDSTEDLVQYYGNDILLVKLK